MGLQGTHLFLFWLQRRPKILNRFLSLSFRLPLSVLTLIWCVRRLCKEIMMSWRSAIICRIFLFLLVIEYFLHSCLLDIFEGYFGWSLDVLKLHIFFVIICIAWGQTVLTYLVHFRLSSVDYNIKYIQKLFIQEIK